MRVLNPDRDIRIVIHGDDFTSIGEQEELIWLAENLKQHFEPTVKATLGPDTNDDKSSNSESTDHIR